MTEAVNMTREAAPERLVVKWATPTDEALGLAKLAGALVSRRIAHPGDIAIAAPNRMWALNLLRACESCGVKASLCIAQSVAALVVGSASADTGLKGFSLVRELGWDKRPELAHALLHMKGDEDARELNELVREQLARPTVAEQTTHIPIMLADELPDSVDYLFIAGCVAGLVDDREAFAHAVASGRVRTTASYFAKAPIELAEAAHLGFARVKTEDGRKTAMMQPSPFLAEAGTWRPTTTGGQALLRRYGLN